MKPVGEFDDDYPQILGHRQKHLSQIFHLLFLLILKGKPAQFSHAVNQQSHFRTKPLANFLSFNRSIFNHIMQ